MLRVIELVKDDEKWNSQMPDAWTIDLLEVQGYEFGDTAFRYILVDDDKLIGYISTVDVNEYMWGVCPTIELVGVNTLEPYRNKGYGKVLIDEALKLCEKHKHHPMQKFVVITKRNNAAAIRLYEKCGFMLWEDSYFDLRDEFCVMIKLDGMSLEDWKACDLNH